jgi:Ca-activated chloride channel homolog
VENTKKQTLIQGGILILKILLITSLCILLAGPYTLRSIENPLKNGIDILLVLDLSKSMLAEDIIPSRMESARSSLQALVARRSEDRVGLIGFAGQPFTLSPLSFDLTGVSDILARTGVDTIRQELPGLSGTALGDGLLLASDEFGEDLKRERVMIVITDGEANVGIPPRDTIALLKQKKIRVHTIGVGDSRWTELAVTNARGQKEYFLDTNGQRIIASIDEPLLWEIAESTGGQYQNAKSAGALDSIITSLGKLEKKQLQAPPTLEKQSLSIWIGIIIWILLLWLAILEQYSPTSLFRVALIHSNIYTPESYNYRIIPILHRIVVVSYILGATLLGYALWALISGVSIPPNSTVSLVVDLSRSMLVEDVSRSSNTPISRLELARESLLSTLEKIPKSQSVSLIGFGGIVQTLVPATLNREAIIAGISGLRAGSIPGGSNLSLLSEYLNSRPDTFALVMTDGAIGDANKRAFARISKSQNPPRIVVIGTEKGGPIPLARGLIWGTGYLMNNGTPVISQAGTSEVSIYFPQSSITSVSRSWEIAELEFMPSTPLFETQKLWYILSFASIFLLLSLLIPARFPLKTHA